jgi:hypothetical protein
LRRGGDGGSELAVHMSYVRVQTVRKYQLRYQEPHQTRIHQANIRGERHL